MIGLIGEPERSERLSKNFGAAPLGCLFEAAELIPSRVALLCLIPLCLFGAAVYHLTSDPNAVDVASQLDMLSIDPRQMVPQIVVA
jgi:hypothetical protein